MNFPWDKNKEIGPVKEEKLPLFSLKGKAIDLSYSGADISSDAVLESLRIVFAVSIWPVSTVLFYVIQLFALLLFGPPQDRKTFN